MQFLPPHPTLTLIYIQRAAPFYFVYDILNLFGLLSVVGWDLDAPDLTVKPSKLRNPSLLIQTDSAHEYSLAGGGMRVFSIH